MNDNKTPFMPVVGYLTSNWNSQDDNPPAVVLNPDARPIDVLVWCWAELESMRAAANVLIAVNDDINKGDFSALIIYRLEPLVDVMERVISQLHVPGASHTKANAAVQS
jgi:hypothetical protein